MVVAELEAEKVRKRDAPRQPAAATSSCSREPSRAAFVCLRISVRADGNLLADGARQTMQARNSIFAVIRGRAWQAGNQANVCEQSPPSPVTEAAAQACLLRGGGWPHQGNASHANKRPLPLWAESKHHESHTRWKLSTFDEFHLLSESKAAKPWLKPRHSSAALPPVPSDRANPGLRHSCDPPLLNTRVWWSSPNLTKEKFCDAIAASMKTVR